MTTCHSCGANLSGTTRFCVKCGAPRDDYMPPPGSWRAPSSELDPDARRDAPDQASQMPPTVLFPQPEQPNQEGQRPPEAQRPPAGHAPPPPGAPLPPPYVPPLAARPAPPPSPLAPNQPPFERPQSGQMPTVAMNLGIATLCFMLVGLIPCLGWLNWLTLSLAFPAIIIGAVAAAMEQHSPAARNKAVMGLVMAGVAFVIGFFRLALGGGCL